MRQINATPSLQKSNDFSSLPRGGEAVKSANLAQVTDSPLKCGALMRVTQIFLKFSIASHGHVGGSEASALFL